MRPFLTLHHPAAARHYYDQGVWQADTFYALMERQAAERPDAPALQDGRRTLTWAQLQSWVDGVAAELRSKGIGGGDRVSIWMSNRAEAIVMFFAGRCAPSGASTTTAPASGTLGAPHTTSCVPPPRSTVTS